MFDMIPNGNKHPANIEDYFDKLFETFSEGFFAGLPLSQMKADLRQTEEAYVIETDIPGVRKQDIQIHYEEPYLTITVKRDTDTKVERQDYVTKERQYGEWRRSFYLQNIKEDQISASFDNGVLKVILPKKQKGIQRARKIDVQ